MGIAFQTVGLLLLSNVFMTLAWYGHLGGENQPTWPPLAFLADLKNRPLMLAVLVSWAIAFVEYLFQVPANRIGSTVMSKSQLKIVQEVISLGVFVAMAVFYWRERVTWNYLLAGLCLIGAVVFIFRDAPTQSPPM
jgi:uncharacterized protein (DUF486 family)